MNAYAGTARLIRLAVRRDRVQLPIWILGSTIMMVAAAAAAKDQFPTEADRVTALAGVVESPAVLLMRGVPVGTSPGAMVNFRNFASIVVLAALMSTFAVVRHTRQNEETGRAEMIGAGSVGRHAVLVAALAVAIGADVLLGAAVTGSLLAAGLPVDGSLAFGAASAAAGVAFAGLAALAAQLFPSARATNACAATAVGIAYLIRGCADAFGEKAPDGIQVTSHWTSWLSPLGWVAQVRPYGEHRWWVLALPLALLGTGAVAAFALVDRRDLGAGVMPARPGPAVAARSLLSPFGLAWRLQRNTVLGWVIGSALFGLGVGSIGGTANDALADNTGVADMMEQLAGARADAIVDAYYAGMMNIFGALAAGFVVQVLLRLRSEEAGGPAEAVLATAVGRVRWVSSHLACAAGGATAMLLLAGAGAGIGDAAVDGRAGVGTLIGAGLAQLPAALVVAGFVLLAFGGLPRLVVGLAWAALAVSIAFGLLGDLFGLPQPVRDLSPFSHVPAIPAADPTAGPILALLVVAAALSAAGMVLFRRRDMVV